MSQTFVLLQHPSMLLHGSQYYGDWGLSSRDGSVSWACKTKQLQVSETRDQLLAYVPVWLVLHFHLHESGISCMLLNQSPTFVQPPGNDWCCFTPFWFQNNTFFLILSVWNKQYLTTIMEFTGDFVNIFTCDKSVREEMSGWACDDQRTSWWTGPAGSLEIKPSSAQSEKLKSAEYRHYSVSTALWIIMNIRAVSPSTAIRAT